MAAQGSLSGFGTNFEGTFYGIKIVLAGSFSQSVERYSAPSVNLTYEKLENLPCTYDIATEGPPSYVGPADLSIKFVNVQGQTASITGPILYPISQRTTVMGSARFDIAREAAVDSRA
ncbi:uncharacterized protein BDW43DRAFT_314841 [Aspergillus alliaceus]|uniref:uncharacterized protein n=1 Tax=Petromyces alliaceus TaxID=209559 RepID=UPI0012A6A5BF|nr:uncharacterized protein BDW43DRAFT_314841 [Aspergillus alliaceus]KAB8229643.1 hypothetical protein BDW43DRAFT_314841 [Aspergillus alliaceus]